MTVGKTSGYNNNILISNIDMKTGLNRNINKVEVSHQYSILITEIPPEAYATPEMHSMKNLDKSVKDAVTILPVGTQKMFPGKYDDEKLAVTLLIAGTGLTA